MRRTGPELLDEICESAMFRLGRGIAVLPRDAQHHPRSRASTPATSRRGPDAAREHALRQRPRRPPARPGRHPGQGGRTRHPHRRGHLAGAGQAVPRRFCLGARDQLTVRDPCASAAWAACRAWAAWGRAPSAASRDPSVSWASSPGMLHGLHSDAQRDRRADRQPTGRGRRTTVPSASACSTSPGRAPGRAGPGPARPRRSAALPGPLVQTVRPDATCSITTTHRARRSSRPPAPG